MQSQLKRLSASHAPCSSLFRPSLPASCIPTRQQQPTAVHHCPQSHIALHCIQQRTAGGLTCSASSTPLAETDAALPASSGHTPTSAETARTIVDISSHGTLSTLSDDGAPLGTYTSYVLEESGHPLLRLRADAVHKANLLREPRCSLFVQPQDLPARLLARVTLIGEAEPVDAATAALAAEQHLKIKAGAVGVDAPQDSDVYFRLKLDRCFYVGGMGTASQAEVISASDYKVASPDVLRAAAPGLVGFFNRERREDMLRIASHSSGLAVEQVYAAELLWLDRLGAYVCADTYSKGRQVLRVKFQRPVLDERDARSVLTMLAQLAWEQERNYVPVVPEAIGA